MASNYTMKFNRNAYPDGGCWIATVRKVDGKGWKTKWLPKKYTEFQAIEAEAFLISWIAEYHQSWIPPKKGENVKVIKSLEFLFPKWLEYRNNHPGTKPNTYKGFVRAGNWILDTPGFDHASIQSLDIETELNKTSVLSAWIRTLKGAPKSRVQVINCLSAFYRDVLCGHLGDNLIHEDVLNPFHRDALKEIIREIVQLGKDTEKTEEVPVDYVNALLSGSFAAVRRLRYLLAVMSGLRDKEIQALTFADLFLSDEIPYLKVDYQLMKRGNKPVKIYEEEIARGVSKEEIFSGDRAVLGLPKRRSRRAIPLHPELVKALNWWKSIGWKVFTGRKPEKDDPIFCRENRSLRKGQKPGDFSSYDSPECLREDLVRVGKGETEYTFHELRHTFATQLDKMGLDGVFVDRLMGHAAKSVAQRNYTVQQLKPLYEPICKLPFVVSEFHSQPKKPVLSIVKNATKTEVA